MSKKNKKNKKYEEDVITLAEKEEEIINSYTDGDIYEDTEYEIDEEDLIYDDNEVEEEPTKEEIVEDNYEDFTINDDDENDNDIDEDNYEEETYEEKKPKKQRKGLQIFFNIILLLVMVVIIMVIVDIVAVRRYNAGPYFALPIHTYEDGGSIEYYGIGYKVIEYNQVQGRRDKEIGLWSMKYSTDPTTIQDIDLSIEMTGNEKATYEKYYKKFVRVISTLKKVDTKKHQITIGYTDEDGKYSLDIVCNIVKDQTNLADLKEGETITVIGTIDNFKLKTKKTNNTIYISNCFAEQ